MKEKEERREEVYEYRKLRGLIVEKFGTQEKFALKLGVSSISVNRKLNCATGFSQKDIEEWSDALGISKEDYPAYFFA